MTRPNISQREHVEALVYAAERLLQAATASPKEILFLKINLARAVSRAKSDVLTPAKQ